MTETEALASRVATPAIDIRRLRIVYGKRPPGTVALKDVTLTVAPGETVGLLGHNGSGKSTLILSIMGLLRPYHGSVQIFGRPADSEEARSQVGLVTERTGLYEQFTVDEVLRLFRSLYGVKATRIAAVIDLFELHTHRATRIDQLSTGWRKRVSLACAYLHQPRILLLDEPFSGLDPLALHDVKSLIRRVQENEKAAVIIASHNLEEVGGLCHRLAILRDGQLVALGALEQLRRRFQSTNSYLVKFERPVPANLQIEGALTIEDGRTVLVDDETVLPVLLREAQRRGLHLEYVRRGAMSLHSLYRRLYEEVENRGESRTG